MQASDASKTIKVRVTLTHDAGNQESLNSAATEAVVLGSCSSAARMRTTTRAELDTVSRFLEGETPAEIAGGRDLSARTVSNQIRSGCRRLGFSDRREIRGWWAAASGYILTGPRRDMQERNDEETAERQ